MLDDGLTIQFIGTSDSGSGDHREGARQFKIVDAGYVDYRCRAWVPLTKPDGSFPKMISFESNGESGND